MTHSVTLTLTSDDLYESPPSLHKDAKSVLAPAPVASDTLLFVVIIVIWYSVSVSHNLLNKRLLEGDLFPFPFTLTLLQLLAITVYSFVYIGYFSTNEKHVVVRVQEVMSQRRHRSLILMLSLGKFLTLVFNHLSLSQVPLAFTHTGRSHLFSSLACDNSASRLLQ